MCGSPKLGLTSLHKPPTGWTRPFEDPIDLPGGRQLVTLEDAGNYITKLPKAAGRLPRGIGVERLRDTPADWSRQFEALRLNPR
jgi:hypothetical protein